MANEIRHAQAQLKRSLADGTEFAADILRDVPDGARNLTVAELLVSQPRWGPAKCKKFLAPHGIGDRKRIGELTIRQRTLLAVQLQHRHEQTTISRRASGLRLPASS